MERGEGCKGYTVGLDVRVLGRIKKGVSRNLAAMKIHMVVWVWVPDLLSVL